MRSLIYGIIVGIIMSIDPKIKEAWRWAQQWADQAVTSNPSPWSILADAFVDAKAGQRMAEFNSIKSRHWILRIESSVYSTEMFLKPDGDPRHMWTFDDWRRELIGEVEAQTPQEHGG